ncbi:MAG TPA: hypothetical protein VEZ16_14745 [Microvirga sp.]|nr:hypothetical protein [Microvirga sp.]
MNKTLRMIAASTLVLGVMIGGAEARKVSYEINGQRFTYDTNDPEQVASARKRIEAANAADAAKAKADAERARNPLAATFGSQAQREAAEAQARLQQVLTEQAAADAALKRRRAAQAAAREEERRKQAEAQAPEPAAVESVAAESTAPAPETNPKPPEAEPPVRSAAEEQAPSPVQQADAAVTKPAATGGAVPSTIKSVSFDVGSGIKTTVMTDGSIHEEPFDSGTLAKLEADPEDAESLNAFVKQLRKAVSVETTGSTVSRATPSR